MSVVYNKIWDGKRGQCYETKHVKKFPKVKILNEGRWFRRCIWLFADSYWFRLGNISMDVNIHETSVRSGRVQKTSMRGGTLGRWIPGARIVVELLSQTMLTASYFKRNVDLPALCLFKDDWWGRRTGLMLLEIWVLKKQCFWGNFLWGHEKRAPKISLWAYAHKQFACLQSLKQYFSSKSDRY